MSQDSYSTYEAKAHLSELLRKVRGGRIVTITYRGDPIAEVRPIQAVQPTLEARLQDLAEDGVLVRANVTESMFCGVAERPGALERFLQERE